MKERSVFPPDQSYIQNLNFTGWTKGNPAIATGVRLPTLKKVNGPSAQEAM